MQIDQPEFLSDDFEISIVVTVYNEEQHFLRFTSD